MVKRFACGWLIVVVGLTAFHGCTPRDGIQGVQLPLDPNNRASEQAVLIRHDSWVESAAFSPDGTRIVTTSSDQTARVWDVASGKALAVLRGHDGVVESAAFSADNMRIATVSRDRTVRVWDIVSGETLAVLRGDNWGPAVAISPDGRRVAATSKESSPNHYAHTVNIWDVASGTVVAVLRWDVHGAVWSVAFNPDGTRVATLASNGAARLWDANDGTELMTLRGHDVWSNSIAFSPNGRRVVTADAGGVARVWDAVNGEELAILRGHKSIRTATFSHDGSCVVTTTAEEGDNTARLWDAGTGAELAVLRGHNSNVIAARTSPDGVHVVTRYTQGVVHIWNWDAHFRPR